MRPRKGTNGKKYEKDQSLSHKPFEFEFFGNRSGGLGVKRVFEKNVYLIA